MAGPGTEAARRRVRAGVTVPSLAETVASFDGRAATYDRSLMHRVVAQHAVVAADPQPGQTLLDLAGGTGLVARAALPQLGGTGRALVLDTSPGMLEQAGRQDARLVPVRADGHHIPLRDDSVDRVTCITALHLFHDPGQALREAARTCRPDGRILFTTWAAGGWSTSRLLRDVAQRHGVDVPDRYARTGTPAAAGELARGAGLSPVDVQLVQHVEPRTEDADSTWARVTAQTPPMPPAVEAAFRAQLSDVVEHRLLLVTCRPG